MEDTSLSWEVQANIAHLGALLFNKKLLRKVTPYQGERHGIDHLPANNQTAAIFQISIWFQLTKHHQDFGENIS